MKPRVLIVSILVGLFLLTNLTYSQVNTSTDIDAKHKVVSKNPIKGLCCTDSDIRLDCVCALGEQKCLKAVPHLMKLLREDSSEAVRIAAAQSLIKIGDPIGVYLVNRSSIFNDNDKVREYCSKFYNAYLYEQYLASLKTNEDEEEAFASLASQE